MGKRNQVKTRPVWSQEFVESHLAEAYCLQVVSVCMTFFCGNVAHQQLIQVVTEERADPIYASV